MLHVFSIVFLVSLSVFFDSVLFSSISPFRCSFSMQQLYFKANRVTYIDSQIVILKFVVVLVSRSPHPLGRTS